MEIKLAIREGDLSDGYLRFARQIGVDGLDIHNSSNIPGVKERGYPDINGFSKLKKRIESYGLKIFRVSAPSVRNYLLDRPGGEKELRNILRTIGCMGKLSLSPLVITLNVFHEAWKLGEAHRTHRGGYTMYTFNLHEMEKKLENEKRFSIDHEKFWRRCINLLEEAASTAEDLDVRIAIHPQDPPVPELKYPWTVGFLGLNRIFESIQSENLGILYCCGTRYESGANIYDEILYFGRRRKIFHVHLRNVRGKIPLTGGYEEVAIDDGEIDLFRVLKTLKEIDYNGVINPDHVPTYIGDLENRMIAWAQAVGYVQGLLAAL